MGPLAGCADTPRGSGETSTGSVPSTTLSSTPQVVRLVDATVSLGGVESGVCFVDGDGKLFCARLSDNASPSAPMSAFDLQCGGPALPACTIDVRSG